MNNKLKRNQLDLEKLIQFKLQFKHKTQNDQNEFLNYFEKFARFYDLKWGYLISKIQIEIEDNEDLVSLGLPINHTSGSMIVNIGAQSTEISIIETNVKYQDEKDIREKFDSMFMEYVKRGQERFQSYNGDPLKLQTIIGAVTLKQNNKSYEVDLIALCDYRKKYKKIIKEYELGTLRVKE